LNDDSFTSAPQLKRDPLGGGLCALGQGYDMRLS